jgi:hypothetical protein
VHSAKCGSTSGHEHQPAQAARPAQLTPAARSRVACCVALGIVRCTPPVFRCTVANRPLRVACGIFGRCMLHLCGVPSAAGLHVAYRPSTTCFCACVRACVQLPHGSQPTCARTPERTGKARHPTRRSIPRGTVSHATRYPMRHGTRPHAVPARTRRPNVIREPGAIRRSAATQPRCNTTTPTHCVARACHRQDAGVG